MKTNNILIAAFGICFVLAIAMGVRAQQIGGGGSGGGGGTPGGSNTQIQYNNSGAFGGSQVLYDGGNGALIIPFDSSRTRGYFFGSVGQGFNTGMLAQGATRLGFVTSSNNVAEFTGADLFTFSAGLRLAWSVNSDPESANDTGLVRNAAGVTEFNNGTAGTYREAKLRSLIVGGTVPGISGCTAGTQTGGATAGTFTSGTTGVCTTTLTFAFTAPTGWSCAANNQTTANLIRQSGGSTTTAIISGTTVSGDVVNFHCMAY